MTLPSDRLKPMPVRAVVGLIVGGAALIALSVGAIALGPSLRTTATDPSPTPAVTTYPPALPLETPTPTPTPTPTETEAPPVVVAPPAPAPAPAPKPYVPIKCPPGTVPGTVQGNGDESNCAPPCQAYDENNVCTQPGSLRWIVRDPEVVNA